MILYHGSNIAVTIPKILLSDRMLDFGTGFYTTSSYEQAERWARLTVQRKKDGSPIVTSYDFNEKLLSDLKILKFETASVDWLKFVSKNRNRRDFYDNSDIVIGPVADDKTMPVIRNFFLGIYDEEEAIKRLLTQRLKDQYAFKSSKALELLKFREAIEVCLTK